MLPAESISLYKQIYYRLIALWVLCEGIIGGMMHALKIPFAGMITGSGAVICICLIAYYVPVKGAILRATIIVAVFKMLISPHSPPTAYIALFFQGCVGQALFFNLRYHRLSCILFAVLALVESAVQRIIVLTILYGTNFWTAINEFIRKIAHQSSVTNYSLFITTGYILVHAIAGLIVGLFAGSIIWQSKSWNILHDDYLIPEKTFTKYLAEKSANASGRKMKALFLFIWVVLVVLFAQSYFNIGPSFLPANLTLQILMRSALVFLTWYFLVSPAISLMLKKWLSRQQLKAESDIQQVTLMLPATKYLLLKSWQLSAEKKGLKRLSTFVKIMLINTLRDENRIPQQIS